MRAGEAPGTARRRLAITTGVAIACFAAATLWPAGPARALSEPTPWTGVNPYHCTLQDAGLGTKVPDPGADPYCVEFNKTDQNVTQLGILTFLLNEPARTAAAVPKCFYFQEDHWRGSIVQSNGKTVLYQFWGHYFFNKATGDGGAWIDDFTIAGKTFDPTTLPFFPAQYKADFGPGTGGVITHDDVPVVSQCVAMAKDDPAGVYADPSDPET
jgi:hypothetical protein